MSNISFKMLALATIASITLSACTFANPEVTPTTSASQTQIITPQPTEPSVTLDTTTPQVKETAKPKESKPEETAKPKESKKETKKPKTTGKDTALVALETITVKGRAPKTGYDRDLFGAAWADVDRNGCDTRNDILARDLTDVTFKQGTNNCVVLSGYLADPFTGLGIHFKRGNKTSMAVQIDHVIPLSDAW